MGKLKRCSDAIQSNKFVEHLLEGGSNFFQEVKKFRGSTSTYSSRIDEEVGAKNISEHFARIYQRLYNNVNQSTALENVVTRIHNGVDRKSANQLNRIDKNVIRCALNSMKAKKADAIFDVSSDFYINCPDELLPHLANLVRIFLCHGSIPRVILLCTLLPLVKDKLGDITVSENYRAIASGCLLLKLIDLIVLNLEGEKLGFDEMQFAYQAKSSTTMCTWTVTSVVEYFNRNGTAVYGAAMDMSKAFDMVEWGELFETLLEREVDCIFLRLILFIYSHQQCDVQWCDQRSNLFSVTNGVRQGGVSSGIFFAIYIDKLLKVLRNAGIGCHINGMFYGAVIYADDIFLLSGSRNGLQAMVDLCHEFVSRRNLKFGTNTNPEKSKTKCVVFSKKSVRVAQPLNISLNGNQLPWVHQVNHLGHVLQSDNSMRIDIARKRGIFIGKINSLLQEFHFVTSDTLLKLMNSYATTLYGSNTWDIFSVDCEKLYTSYNVAIRQILRVDRCTHRYLIEPLSKCFHLKTVVASRYITFYKTLLESKKKPVRYLARLNGSDLRTVMGRTLQKLTSLLKMNTNKPEELTAGYIKRNLKYFEVPADKEWRVPICNELLDIRHGDTELKGFTTEECIDMLSYICSS